MKRHRKGFTLVELAIVIAILGILAVVAIPKYQGMVDEARSAEARAQLGTVRSAIAISYAKNKGTMPATLTGALFAEGTVPFVEITNPAGTVINSNGVVAVASEAGGWLYVSGAVHINSITGTDPAATPSTTLWSSY